LKRVDFPKMKKKSSIEKPTASTAKRYSMPIYVMMGNIVWY